MKGGQCTVLSTTAHLTIGRQHKKLVNIGRVAIDGLQLLGLRNGLGVFATCGPVASKKKRQVAIHLFRWKVLLPRMNFFSRTA